MSTLEETGVEQAKPAEKDAVAAKRRQTRKPTRAGIVDKMIVDFNKKIKKGDIKFSVADFIRLVQLRQDLHEDEPREVKVTWIEPNETESASET